MGMLVCDAGVSSCPSARYGGKRVDFHLLANKTTSEFFSLCELNTGKLQFFRRKALTLLVAIPGGHKTLFPACPVLLSMCQDGGTVRVLSISNYQSKAGRLLPAPAAREVSDLQPHGSHWDTCMQHQAHAGSLHTAWVLLFFFPSVTNNYQN